jgi:protein SCO1/2
MGLQGVAVVNDAKRTIPVGTLALFLLWLILMAIAYRWWRPATKPVSAELRNALWSEPRPLQSFSLVDLGGKPFSEASLRDKWTFLFFGSTWCPDICPTTMAVLKRVHDLLRASPQDAAPVQVVFASVDPERDTPEVLKKYMAYFDESFVGITGHRSQIDNLVAQARAGYVKEPEQAPGQYLITHSSSIFLIDPAGQLLGAFSPPLYPDVIASLFKELRGLY